MFRLPLDVPGSALAKLEHLLAAEEQMRASQFAFDSDRTRFIGGRATLRAILSRYLGITPAGIAFRYGPRGKPALDVEGKVRFNISHSAGLALIAVVSRREVGVDLERIAPENACHEVASQLFSPVEAAALARLAPAEHLSAFFRCWTRKEAYVKARGDGLSIPLASFDVSPEKKNSPIVLNTSRGGEDASRWTVTDIDAGSGFAAALAVEGTGIEVRQFQWQAGEF